MVKKSKSSLLKILKNPNKISQSEAIFIDELVKEFPYFQAARAIQLKNHKNLESFQFEKILNKTAIYTSNRRILFDFIEHNYLADCINSKNSKTQKVIKKTESKTFVNWLEQVNLVPIDRSNESSTIEKFISKKPKLNIKSIEEPEIHEDNESTELIKESLVTETLAKLYVEQENYEKAIQTYKILILKFPEKNSYFASAIKKLKKLK
tara:strand:+ start:2637 stop:3260 length:624 start_codon:yes stop_codon:yes gene_type:complete